MKRPGYRTRSASTSRRNVDGNSRLRAIVTATNNAGSTVALSGLSAVVILR